MTSPRATTDPVEIVVAEHASDPQAHGAGSDCSRAGGGPRFWAEGDRALGGRQIAVLPVRSRRPRGSTPSRAVRELRSTIVPAAFENTDAEVLVGGTTAENIDYFDSVIGPAPW